MHFQKLVFENADGKKLSARLDLPADEKPLAFAIFAHCFTCNKNYNAVVNINRALAARGIAVLRFDFTGLGESEGDFAETGFRTNVRDVVSAAEFLARDFEAPRLLIGHSLGGAAVLQAAEAIPSVRAVATIAAPSSLSHLTDILGSSSQEIRSRGEAEVCIAGREFTIGKRFVDDLDEDRMEETIRLLRKPLLLFHSPRDTVVDIDHAARIFVAAKHPKSFVSLDTADHLMSERSDSLYVGSVLASWAARYIGLPEDPKPDRDLSDNRIVVRIGKRGYQTEIVANGHHLVADEPIAVGGANTGPNPYDYLVSALGACTAMTLRMYADRKKWPLDGVTVRLRHRKIHAADCESCEIRQGSIDAIEREIELLGNLDADQRTKLLQIADKCPVHRTLHGEIRVDSRLKE